jgi:Protein of unknown function (DUF2795)
MNINLDQLKNLLLNSVPYPIGKAQLLDFLRQRQASDQIIAQLERLPDVTFNSAQDVQNALSGGLGNIGGIRL